MKKIISFIALIGLVIFSFTGCFGILYIPAIGRADDTELDFWILDYVGNYDFSEYEQMPGMGVTGYYGKGYKKDDEEYVRYDVTSYPDTLSPGSFITDITVTDPDVVIMNGLTASSSIEQWDDLLRSYGFRHTENKYRETDPIYYYNRWESIDGRTAISVSRLAGTYTFRFMVEVTNKMGIYY